MTKQERRAAMPFCTEVIDRMREIFKRDDGKEPFPYFRCTENNMVIEWGKRTEYAE